MEYQTNYTENSVAKSNMYDEAGRIAKSEKILAVLQDYFGDTSSLDVLDASCSTGFMVFHLAGHFREMVGIDIDETAVEFATAENCPPNGRFHVMDALNTGFGDGEFDVVICNQMYEHVPDAVALMREIERILKPGGVCYFGATNRLKVIETHYGRLPFLSYLPKTLANLYLKLLGRGDRYYENLRTYWTLRRLCRDFELVDYTIRIVREPARFKMADVLEPGSTTHRLALGVLRYAYWFSPGYVWLLRKHSRARA